MKEEVCSGIGEQPNSSGISCPPRDISVDYPRAVGGEVTRPRKEREGEK